MQDRFNQKQRFWALWGLLWLLGGLQGCGDAVSDLVNPGGSDEATPSTPATAFKELDEDTKKFFSTIEVAKPSENIRFSVDVFSFLSTESVVTKNLEVISFEPETQGAKATSGAYQFPGFIAIVKLTDTLKCGKFVLSDLKILFCPGSWNFISTKPMAILEATGTAKRAEITEADVVTQEAFDSIADKDVLKAEKKVDDARPAEERTTPKETEATVEETVEDVEGKGAFDTLVAQVTPEATPTPTPTPTPSPYVVPTLRGSAPPSFGTVTEVALGTGGGTRTAAIALSPDETYVAVAVSFSGTGVKTIGVYKASDLSLVASANIAAGIVAIGGVGFSQTGDKIYIVGRASFDTQPTLVIIQIPFTNNALGTETSTTVANSSLPASVQYSITIKVVHEDPSTAGQIKVVATGFESTFAERTAFVLSGTIAGGFTVTAVNETGYLTYLPVSVLNKNYSPTTSGSHDGSAISYYSDYTQTNATNRSGIFGLSLGSLAIGVNFGTTVNDALKVSGISFVTTYDAKRHADADNSTTNIYIIGFRQPNSGPQARVFGLLNSTTGLVWSTTQDQPNAQTFTLGITFDKAYTNYFEVIHNTSSGTATLRKVPMN